LIGFNLPGMQQLSSTTGLKNMTGAFIAIKWVKDEQRTK